MIIQVRICHPHNERKMNLQSQMQIYLLIKRERGKRREKQGEEGHMKQREEIMNKATKNEDRICREAWVAGQRDWYLETK